MATIKDVAKMAHVSVATVSRVINKKKYVNDMTKQMVLDAIEKLDYVPNELARSLFQKQSRIIGIIVPHMTSYYFLKLLEVIEDAVTSHDFHLMVCNSQDNVERESKYLEVFQQYNIDGILLISNTTRILDYQSLAVPIVAIDHRFTDELPSVSSNNFMGGRLAAEKLVATGCKKIIHFRGPSVLLTVQERTKGFKSVLEKNNIYNFSFDLAFKAPSAEEIDRVIKANLDCDGVFCDSDVMAFHVVQSLQKNGRHVPEDVQVIGFDNIELAQMVSPKLSTIAQATEKVGAAAVEMLLNLIEDKPVKDLHQQIDVELIERETTR